MAKSRALKVFTKAQKLKLRDPDFKFHLEQTGPESFELTPIKEFRLGGNAVGVFDQHASQPLQFALRVHAPAERCIITLPDGGQIKVERTIQKGHYIVCKSSEVYVANEFRKKVADVPLARAATLPAGEAKLSVEFPDQKVSTDWTVWICQEGVEVRK